MSIAIKYGWHISLTSGSKVNDNIGHSNSNFIEFYEAFFLDDNYCKNSMGTPDHINSGMESNLFK